MTGVEAMVDKFTHSIVTGVIRMIGMVVWLGTVPASNYFKSPSILILGAAIVSLSIVIPFWIPKSR